MKSKDAIEGGLQEAEISTRECAACSGCTKTDGQLMHEWIKCTDPDCGKWMHVDCLSTDSKGEMYFCSVCNKSFC